MTDTERGSRLPSVSGTGNNGNNENNENNRNNDDQDAGAGSPPCLPTARQWLLFTPQKPNQLPLETITPAPPPTPIVHLPNTPGERPNRFTVNRRLLFDSGISKSATPPVKKQPEKKRLEMVNNSIIDDNDGLDQVRKKSKIQISTLPEMTIDSNVFGCYRPDVESIDLNVYGRYRPVVESLLDRGFVVQKLLKESTTGDKPLLDGADDDCSSVFECMSLMEGSVYNVHVVALRDKADAFLETVKTLADIGPHPYIVSYFYNWMDGRFHYMQTEPYLQNLWTPTGGQRQDCRTVLEHVSCALHHLHVYKKYAHNLVNRRYICWTTHCGGVVYKLTGFHGATKLTTTDDGDAANAIFADVKSLCSTVAELLEEQRCDVGNPTADGRVEQELRSYLLSVTDKTEMPAGVIAGGSSPPRTDVSALNVWRWSCKTRWQTKKQKCPTGLAVKRIETQTSDTSN